MLGHAAKAANVGARPYREFEHIGVIIRSAYTRTDQNARLMPHSQPTRDAECRTRTVPVTHMFTNVLSAIVRTKLYVRETLNKQVRVRRTEINDNAFPKSLHDADSGGTTNSDSRKRHSYEHRTKVH